MNNKLATKSDAELMQLNMLTDLLLQGLNILGLQK
jgi:hypothetical protein